MPTSPVQIPCISPEANPLISAQKRVTLSTLRVSRTRFSSTAKPMPTKKAFIIRSSNLSEKKTAKMKIGIALVSSSVIGVIAGKQDKAQLMETFNSFVQIMDSMVIILVVAAVILGVVVLYNLGIMSYVERSRELATLKVLGFRNRTIGKLLISQNIWLTVIGVIIGLPAGVGVLQWLLTALAGEYEMKLMLGALTYSVSILLTFGVSLLVGLMVAGKNKKIDMVEALKGTE